MKKHFLNVFAALMSIMLIAGCATSNEQKDYNQSMKSSLDDTRKTAEEALSTAQKANTKAQEALDAARRAQETAEQANERSERVFKKGMMK